MIPAPFEYELADSVEQAVELLGPTRTRRCSPAATRCCPLMRLRIARPSLLVDIGRLA